MVVLSRGMAVFRELGGFPSGDLWVGLCMSLRTTSGWKEVNTGLASQKPVQEVILKPINLSLPCKCEPLPHLVCNTSPAHLRMVATDFQRKLDEASKRKLGTLRMEARRGKSKSEQAGKDIILERREAWVEFTQSFHPAWEVAPESLQQLRSLVSCKQGGPSTSGAPSASAALAPSTGAGTPAPEAEAALQRLLRTSASEAEAKRSLQTLSMILQNLLSHPTQEKYKARGAKEMGVDVGSVIDREMRTTWESWEASALNCTVGCIHYPRFLECHKCTLSTHPWCFSRAKVPQVFHSRMLSTDSMLFASTRQEVSASSARFRETFEASDGAAAELLKLAGFQSPGNEQGFCMVFLDIVNACHTHSALKDHTLNHFIVLHGSGVRASFQPGSFGI